MRSASPGKNTSTLASVHGSGVALRFPAKRDQVLPHAQVGEDLASFGTSAMPRRAMPVGPLALDALAAETDDSASRRGEAHDRAHRRRLSHAVAPEQRRHFACADREIEAEQHLARSVGGFRVFPLGAARS